MITVDFEKFSTRLIFSAVSGLKMLFKSNKTIQDGTSQSNSLVTERMTICIWQLYILFSLCHCTRQNLHDQRSQTTYSNIL